MKKKIRIMMFSLMIFTLVGCQIKSEDKNINQNQVSKNENNLIIEIIASQDSGNFNEMPITLNSKIIGKVNQEIQYRWKLEYDEQYKNVIGFISEGSGPLEEIVNSGEDVEIGFFAELLVDEDAIIEFRVNLELEDKENATTIKTDKIRVEYRDGVFKIE